jgi:hypothetical protein
LRQQRIIDYIVQSGISAESIEKILGGNAQALLGL